MVNDDSSDYITFSPHLRGAVSIAVFARLNSQICIHVCDEGFMHSSPTVTSLSILTVDRLFLLTVWSHPPLTFSCQLSKNCLCFVTYRTVAQASQSSNVHCRAQFLTKFTHVTSQPVEQSVTEAPAIHAPTMNPHSKSLRSYITYLLPSWYKIRVRAGPPQQFYTCHRAW